MSGLTLGSFPTSVLIAGPTASGKTSTLCHTAVALVQIGKRVGFFSFEGLHKRLRQEFWKAGVIVIPADPTIKTLLVEVQKYDVLMVDCLSLLLTDGTQIQAVVGDLLGQARQCGTSVVASLQMARNPQYSDTAPYQPAVFGERPWSFFESQWIVHRVERSSVFHASAVKGAARGTMTELGVFGLPSPSPPVARQPFWERLRVQR